MMRKAAKIYSPFEWWGVVVFTCFGSSQTTRILRDAIAKPY